MKRILTYWQFLLFFFAILQVTPLLGYYYNNYRILEVLLNPSEKGISRIINVKPVDCQGFLLSVALLTTDMEKARNALDSAKNCSNHEDIQFWIGELEYRLGNITDATNNWMVINIGELLSYGTYEYYFGDPVKAFQILQIILDTEKEENLNPGQKSYLYSTLAHIYRDNDDDDNALKYSKLAWDEGGQTYDVSYQLGSQYYEAGKFSEAIYVLEIGLQNKIADNFYSQLDFSYYSRLVECYILLGDIEKAMSYYILAENTFKKEIQLKTSHDVLEIQQNRLNWLRQSLDSINDNNSY